MGVSSVVIKMAVDGAHSAPLVPFLNSAGRNSRSAVLLLDSGALTRLSKPTMGVDGG